MAILAQPIRSRYRRTTAPVRWVLIAACVLSVHVVVLAVGRAGASGESGFKQVGLSLRLEAEDEPPASPQEMTRPPAEFLNSLKQADVFDPITPPELSAAVRPGNSKTQRTQTFPSFRSSAGEDAVESGRGEVGFSSDDLPLATEPLAPQASNTPSSGELTGFTTGNSGESGKGSFAKVLSAMAKSAPREALRLPGKPAYPRACRQGLCRNGVPCEGASEWQITVAAAGGKPLKVECLKKMECELQNASIRKFFSETKFEPIKEDTIYIFPVKMSTQQ